MRPGSLAGARAPSRGRRPRSDGAELLAQLAVDLVDGGVEPRGELRRGGRDRLGRLLGGLPITRSKAFLVVVDELLVVLHRVHELVGLGLNILRSIDAIEVE